MHAMALAISPVSSQRLGFVRINGATSELTAVVPQLIVDCALVIVAERVNGFVVNVQVGGSLRLDGETE